MNRIDELEQIILKAQKEYYAGTPSISDAEFDTYWDELKMLDPSNEILQKVGSDLGDSNGFPKVTLNIVAGSQSKANTADEMDTFFTKNGKKKYLAEYKMDGSSIIMDYINGKLFIGASRGDGSVGVDYTPNVKKMIGVPETINTTESISIRGEVLLAKKARDKYFPDAANCRNQATGIFHRIDGSDCDKLTVVVYDAQFFDKSKSFGTQLNRIKFLEENGFIVAPYKVFDKPTGKDAIAYLNEVWANIDDVDFDIDGIVWKANDIDMADITSNYRPTTQIALKPARTLKKTKIIGIDWRVRNGTLTPVAQLEPIEMLGSIVSQASLANIALMEDLGIEIGHEVMISKCGEIIPKILQDVTTGKIAKGYEDSFNN